MLSADAHHLRALPRLAARFARRLTLGLTTACLPMLLAAAPTPPRPAERPVNLEKHGDVRVDPYYWFQERDNPEVKAHLEAENAYTEASLEPFAALREQLFQELVARQKETDAGAPTPDGPFHYWWKIEAGQQYRTYWRQARDGTGEPQLILDVNALAEGQAYFDVTGLEPSPDHRYLAYAVDTSGDRIYTLYFKDLQTGETLPLSVPNYGWSMAWHNDSQTFFYTTLDDIRRPDKVWRLALGQELAAAVQVFHEPDERFYSEIERSASGRHFLLSSGSMATSSVQVLFTADPLGSFALLLPRVQGVRYSATEVGDEFFIRTDERAPNFKVVALPQNAAARAATAKPRLVVPHNEAVLIEGLTGFAGHAVLYERTGGLERLRVLDLAKEEEHVIAQPEAAYMVSVSTNKEFATTAFRFLYASPSTPYTLYDYDLNTRQKTLRKRQEIPSGHNPDDYVVTRTMATAPDGTAVPMTIVHRRGLALDGSHPALLYGYGSYGISTDPGFYNDFFPLINRGFVLALGHVRGGSELGRQWYEDGRLGNKKNTFSDFVACAEHLVAQGYTRSDKLGIMGGSAGGLLMGATMNLRPDLFRAASVIVPFVDVVTTMLDPDLPLTVIEYEQWGNPNEEEAYRYIRSYSPYDNLRAAPYPAMLVEVGFNDPQVPYWEGAKFAARARTLTTSGHPVLLAANMGAGHGGSSGRYDGLREDARRLAFFLWQLGALPQ